MLDEKIKKVLLDEYNKEDNYQKILESINKMKNKKNTFSKLINYRFVPCVITLVLCIIILQNKNIKSKLAKENINQNEITKEYEIAERSIIQKENSQKEIYDTIMSETSYSLDPTIPSNLLKGANRHIVKVKVKSIGEAEFIPTTSYYNNPYEPCTPIEIEVISNLYGDNIIPKDNKIYISGGDIRIANLEKKLDKTDTERLGINNLSNDEKMHKYMRYISKYSYDFEIGKEYVLILGDIGDGFYKVVDDGCGIFLETSSKAEMVNINNLKNVITNVEVNEQDLIKEAKELKVEK